MNPVFEAAMKEQLGVEFDAFAESMKQASPVSVRLNPRKKFLLETVGNVPWSTFGRYLAARPSFTLDPHFHAGTYYVQEASSMFIEQALRQHADLSKPLNALDLCAAPGGKSTHLLSLLSSESTLISNEVIRSRASILSENITKWGYPNAIVTNNDPQAFSNLESVFDLIVLDAPCSGEGLFRKDANAIGEWSPQNVQLCAARQRRIISDVWDSLKEGGLLLYSTCTYNKLENEENLQWLAAEKDVEFLPIDMPSEWGIRIIEDNTVLGYRFFPHQVKGEGFFFSLIRKKGSSTQRNLRSKKSLTLASARQKEIIKSYLIEGDGFDVYQHDDFLFTMPETSNELLNIARQHLHIVQAGTKVGTAKHDKIIPEHALALSIYLNREAFPIVEIPRETAIQYLRREIPQIEATTRGFNLITHNDNPLGFINWIGNRYNSLYPTEWRIRMSAGPE